MLDSRLLVFLSDGSKLFDESWILLLVCFVFGHSLPKFGDQFLHSFRNVIFKDAEHRNLVLNTLLNASDFFQIISEGQQDLSTIFACIEELLHDFACPFVCRWILSSRHKCDPITQSIIVDPVYILRCNGGVLLGILPDGRMPTVFLHHHSQLHGQLENY